MSSYNNMNVALDEDEEEPLDIEIEEDKDDKGDAAEENSSVDEAKDDSKSKSPEESQLAGMITVVWILAIIGLVITVASSVIKHRQESVVKTEYINVASGMYSMSALSTEDKVWLDHLTVEKKIQINGNTVAFYLTGKADSYGKIVYIPVTRTDFNSVENGSDINFTYSRLNIDGKENIIVHQWNTK